MAELFEVKAVHKNLAMSPQKARLVVDTVRGMDAEAAMNSLRFLPNKAAEPVYKLIASAIANAEENFGLEIDELTISRIYADDGPRRRKAPYGGRFAGRGRFRPIVRRWSHITVVLAEKDVDEF